MFQKRFARRKRFPTPMMIRHANGVKGTEKEQRSSWRQT